MLLFLDSFDDRPSSQYQSKYDASSVNFSSTTGRTGSAANIRYGAGTAAFLQKNFTARPSYIVGFAISVDNFISGTDRKFLQVFDGATVQLYLRYTTTGTVELHKGDGTLLATSTIGLTLSQFAYIELSCTIHNTTGAYALLINGLSAFSATNVNTRNTANNQATGIQFYGGNDWSGNLFFDDLYIADPTGTQNTTFLGAVKVECKFPSAAGTTTQLTPTGVAANWDAVNDTTADDDTTYVASSTVGQKDTYALQDLTIVAGSIIGVQFGLRARKDDVATRQVCPVRRVGTTDYDGTPFTLTSTYANYYQVDELNPATSTPYSIAAVNAMEVGVKVVA